MVMVPHGSEASVIQIPRGLAPPPTNRFAGEQPIERNNSQANDSSVSQEILWLNNTYLKVLKEAADHVRTLFGLDPNNNRHQDLHPLQKLLQLGFEREESLRITQQNDKLIWVKWDKVWLLVFEPYQEVAKVTKKYLVQGLPNPPKFDVDREWESVEQAATSYGEECKDQTKTILEARLALIEDHLSKYHQYYLKRQMGAARYKTKEDAKSVAQSKMLESRVRNPELQEAATPNNAGCLLQESTSIITPMRPVKPLPTPGTKRRRCDEPIPEIGIPRTWSTAYDSNLHLSIPESTQVPERDDNVIDQLLQYTSVPPTAPETCNEHNELLKSLFVLLRKKYGADLACLESKVRNRMGMSDLGRIACSFEEGMKLEKNSDDVCVPYRNMVLGMIDWVVRLEQLGFLNEPIAQELEEEARRSCNKENSFDNDTELTKVIEKHAEQSVVNASVHFHRRAAVVDPYLTPTDRHHLRRRMVDAKAKAQQEAKCRMWEQCCKRRGFCNHLLIHNSGTCNATDPVLNHFTAALGGPVHCVAHAPLEPFPGSIFDSDEMIDVHTWNEGDHQVP